MAVLKKSLRELATAPLSGFRTKVIIVSEWEGATVVLREPSPAGWARWRDVMKPGEGDGETEAPALSLSEEAQRNIRADVVMLIDVLLDEDRQPVFTQADAEAIVEFYGPVHSRLLRQALDLQTTAADAEKKSESQKPDS